jgi:hypothetical protein
MDLNEWEEAFPGSRSRFFRTGCKTNPTGKKETIMMPQKLKLSVIRLIALGFVCLGIAPLAQAVGPDTDGSILGSNNGEGIGVLVNRTFGVWNTGTGFQALNQLTTGGVNTATGVRALDNSTTGGYNTATGVYSLFSNVDGGANTADGWQSLLNNTSGFGNVAMGARALANNTDGDLNTAIGTSALTTTTGASNTAVGAYALQNTAASDNTAIGASAGINITGSGNVCIGAGVNGVAGEGNTTRIRNIATTPLNTGMFLEVDTDGKIGFITSSRRYKHDIEPMGNTSEALFALKPVTFRYNGDIDPAHVKMFGLIAEEVAKVNPDLAVRNAKGEVAAIRFDSINAMLLNEFLKEHRKVGELQATVAQQQKGLEVLTAQLKEQAAQIQKVSAQLETSKPASQVVVNTP